MPAVPDNEFLDHVMDLLRPYGPVSGRKMFGGVGIFLEGLMFAIIIDDVLYLKADEETVHRFEEMELPPFVYQRQGKDVALSYYQAPDEALDNPEDMADWADMAYMAASRADSRKKKSKK